MAVVNLHVVWRTEGCNAKTSPGQWRRRLVFLKSLEGQPRRKLYLAWRVARRLNTFDSVATRIVETLHIESIEGIHIYSQIDSFRDGKHLEQR